MKKLESSLKNMTVVLTLISVIAGGLLAYVNKVTAGPIEQINAKNLAEGIKKAIGNPSAQLQKTDTLSTGEIIYSTDKGVAVAAKDPNGFGGDLEVLVGFDNDGNIKGYTIQKSSETPGLGAKAKDWFQADSKGSIIGKNPGTTKLTVRKDGGEVDAITASTITSRAFLRAVNNAYNAYKSKQPATDVVPVNQEAVPADSTNVKP